MERISKEFKLSTCHAIATECLVSKGNEKMEVIGDPITLKALWDTGATFCAINPEKAKKLGLQALGKDNFLNKNGRFDSDIYVVNVHFSATWIEPVVVYESIVAGYDFLIGMDLIVRGDFLIKQLRDGFLFSFEKI